jgi:hypothetical protein
VIFECISIRDTNLNPSHIDDAKIRVGLMTSRNERRTHAFTTYSVLPYKVVRVLLVKVFLGDNGGVFSTHISPIKNEDRFVVHVFFVCC